MEETMALVHRDTHVADWLSFGWPERWRRLFEFDDGQEWLRVEEFHDGDTLVVRAELPDIDPEMDVEITADDGVVRIKARHEEKKERKQKRGYRSEFRYGEFEREIDVPNGATAKDVKAYLRRWDLGGPYPCPEKSTSASAKTPVSRK
jgi:HSP20 family protein